MSHTANSIHLLLPMSLHKTHPSIPSALLPHKPHPDPVSCNSELNNLSIPILLIPNPTALKKICIYMSIITTLLNIPFLSLCHFDNWVEGRGPAAPRSPLLTSGWREGCGLLRAQEGCPPSFPPHSLLSLPLCQAMHYLGGLSSYY